MKKRCHYCGKLFNPDLRQKGKQITCGQLECQKIRRRENSRRWRRNNKDYGKKRYPFVKEWLKKHPGYLKIYRQSHPDYVEANRQKQKVRDKRRKAKRAGTDLDIQIASPLKNTDNKLKTGEIACISRLDKRIARSLNFLVFDGKTTKLAPFLDIQIALDKIRPPELSYSPR
jgi:hypothetical protein